MMAAGRVTQHPAAVKMWRFFNTKMVGLYQYFHLIFGTATYQPLPPSEQIVHTASILLKLLNIRNKEESKEDTPDNQGLEALEKGVVGQTEPEIWDAAKSLLSECSELESLLQVTNENGYNVLLMAVIQEDRDVLSTLINEGCSLNIAKCTMPLHLAAKRGSLPMVQYLLAAGADPGVEAGMCFPHPHAPTRHVPSRFHFLETDIFTCDSDHKLPLMYAIEGDHVGVVRCLLETDGEPLQRWPYHRHPLHYAAQCGAYNCVRYLIEVKPEEINVCDEEGLTPLLHAVKWGQRYVKVLIESGANVHALTHKYQCALHLLYEQVRNPLELYDTTKFLLGTGLEQGINQVDKQGNSPLHCLITQVNRLVESFPVKTTNPDAQEEYDTQVLDTLELLLSYNCDPVCVNVSGVTVLHKLFLMVDVVMCNDPTCVTSEPVPARELFKVDFDLVHSALSMLLDHKAEPDTTTSAGRTALIILLQMALNIDPAHIEEYRHGLLQCLSLLLSTGAHPSRKLVTHINVITLLSKMGHKCLMIREPDTQSSMSELLKDIMGLLLRHGLESNHCSSRRKPTVEGASGNILLEMVKLAQYIRKADDLLFIFDWVLTLLQWGANPDIEPYPSDPIICHSQSSIFLKPKGSQAVNQYMYEIQDFHQIFEGGYAEKLLMLFYNSMDHEALFQCMSTAKFLSRFDPNRAPSGKFLKLINTLSSQPRSLQQISRVAIYKAMNRQLNLRVPQLPLPVSMQRYLVNVE